MIGMHILALLLTRLCGCIRALIRGLRMSSPVGKFGDSAFHRGFYGADRVLVTVLFQAKHRRFVNSIL